MRAKITMAIILLFLLCAVSEFAVNGLADFPYLEKLFGQKKKVVEETPDHFNRRTQEHKVVILPMATSMSIGTVGCDFHTWNEYRKEVDDR
jgi:hypothetical protein